MNIKSLLLGSAAALVAVSGARAADAVVVAEPEPVEYVRVCDVYGAGFYYMPGTETCLKISGYMRYDIGAGDINGLKSIDKKDFIESNFADESTNDTYDKRARFQLRVDSRSETELGTLRAYGAFNFQYDTNKATGDFNGDVADGGEDDEVVVTAAHEVEIADAYIELGGFRVGKTDSLFSTFTGYGADVIDDAPDGLSYGPFSTHQIAYTFNAGNGFSAAIALEEGGGKDDDATITIDGVSRDVVEDLYTLDSYLPHVVGGIGYTGGWGGVSAVVGYDSVFEEVAVKGRLDVKATEALSLFVMAGWKSDTDYTVTIPTGTNAGTSVVVSGLNYYGPWNGDWAIWGGGSWQVTPQAAANLQVGYTETEDFAVAANVAYELVPGFKITPEVDYHDNFDADDSDQWGGWLRFQRNF